MSTDETKALADQTRDQLNELAASLGIEAPDKLGPKAEVIAAIEAAQAPLVAEEGTLSGPAQQVEQAAEIVATDFFQAFEAPEPVTFAKAYRYVGPGKIAGVANEDLSEAAVKQLPPDLHREVAASPFYEAVEGGK